MNKTSQNTQMQIYLQNQQEHKVQMAKLDRKFALRLNEYLDQLEQVFLAYCLLDGGVRQGQGRIGIQSFLKFIRQFEIMEKD